MKVRTKKLSGWLLLLSTMEPMPSAEQTKGPDALIQASTQAAHAQMLLDRCSYRDAEEWLRRALETAHGFRSANSVERDTAGSLVARIEIQLAELQGRRKLLDRGVNEHSRLVSAQAPEPAGRGRTRAG